MKKNKCPFKRQDVCVYSLGVEKGLFGPKYDYCLFLRNNDRAFDGNLYDECIGEKNCPIFKNGDFATLLYFLKNGKEKYHK